MFFDHRNVQEETKKFNEKLRQDPENEDLWLDFVDFQDISIGDSNFNSGNEKISKKIHDIFENMPYHINLVIIYIIFIIIIINDCFYEMILMMIVL